jgi:hypothetical protein
MQRPVPSVRRLRSSRLSALFVVTWIAFAAPPAAADEIVVEGEVAAGQVVRVGPKGLEVETRYGKGNVLVPFERVTTLQTERSFVVIHGDDGETRGRLLGVREGALLVGNEDGGVTAIPVETLFDSVTEEEYLDSARTRWRSRLRYWTARHDLAFAATDATTNTLALSTGFEIERRKNPTRFLMNASYRYGVKDDPSGNDSRESTTENEVIGSLRGEYTYIRHLYAFAAGAAEHDAVESLSLRLTPKVGLGVHILERENLRWDVDMGPAYVYERFFGGDRNRYAAVAFGTDAFLRLPFGATLTARGEYLPAVDDWTGDYLLRGSAALQVPMSEWIALRSSVIDQYDNTPADESSQNSLTFLTGLSLVF